MARPPIGAPGSCASLCGLQASDLLLQDVTWCEPEKYTDTNDRDDQVVKVSDHRDEVGYHIDGRRQVQDQTGWDGAQGQWDARVAGQCERQFELVTYRQPGNSLNQSTILRFGTAPHQPDNHGQEDAKGGKAKPNSEPE